MRWDDLHLLLEVHRRGSFLEAAKALELSTSTVARRMTALEKSVGRTLIHRTAKGTTVDASAHDLLGVAEGFEQALAARARDEQRGSAFAGVVRVSVPDGFAAGAAEAAQRWRERHPETIVEVSCEQRMVDLAAREADIGLRGARSTSSALIDKPLGALATGLYASQSYLMRALPKRVLADREFSEHDFVVDDAGARGKGWAAVLAMRGAKRFPFRANSVEARIHAAKRGAGIIALAIGTEQQHPELSRIELETPMPSLRFYLSMHRDLRNMPRVRGVADALAGVVAEYLELQVRR